MSGHIVAALDVAPILSEHHYLGPSKRGFAWRDDDGVMVFAKPTSRHLPQDGSWLELTRWCLYGRPNAGSQQWARAWRAIAVDRPEVTTFISYSDPAVGHTGALYRACNWRWAPTWQRLRPPPTGNGFWGGDRPHSVKDRWVFPIRKEADRAALLAVKDSALIRRGCFQYSDPRRMPKVGAAAPPPRLGQLALLVSGPFR